MYEGISPPENHIVNANIRLMKVLGLKSFLESGYAASIDTTIFITVPDTV